MENEKEANITKDSGLTGKCIRIGNQLVPVTDEVYEAYHQMDRQERYQDEKQQEFLHNEKKRISYLLGGFEAGNDVHSTGKIESGSSGMSYSYSISAEEAYFRGIAKEEQEALLDKMALEFEKLPEHEKELITLSAIEGKSYREISIITNRDRRTVAAQDKIIRVKLRKAVTGKGPSIY